jgi:hypothetical protein
MLAIKYLLMVAGVLLLAAGTAITIYDLWRMFKPSWGTAGAGDEAAKDLTPAEPVRWRTSVALGVVACLPLLIAMSIVVVPSGMGGVSISDTRGTLPGTLYSGVHFIAPLGEHVQTFDLRDKVYSSTMPGEEKRKSADTSSKEPEAR